MLFQLQLPGNKKKWNNLTYSMHGIDAMGGTYDLIGIYYFQFSCESNDALVPLNGIGCNG